MKKEMILKKAAPRKEHNEEERIPSERAASLGLLIFQGRYCTLRKAEIVFEWRAAM